MPTHERRETDTEPAERAFVLGLDGVPWRYVRTWAEAGELPNFARILRDGVSGPLQSTTPASTPLAWPSIVTGTWPDKHGIYDFQKLSPEYTHRLNTNADLRRPELWRMVSPSVVANVPMTYPVEEIDGKLVAGPLSPKVNERYAHPPELVEEVIEEIPDYEISLDWSRYVGKESEFLDALTSLVEARRTLMRALMRTEDWRLFFFTYMAPDRLQHLVWDEDVLLSHYKHIDEILGEVMEYALDADADLFVVSDHGFSSVSERVAVNTLLEREGFLRRKEESGTRSVFERAGIDKSRLVALVARFGIDVNAFAKRYLPRSVVDFLASQVPGDHSLYDLDHARTAAFVHGYGNVYVNDAERFDEGPVDPDDVPALKAELVETFESVTDPATGDPVLTVHDGDELFPSDPFSPDLVLETNGEYELTKALGEDVFVESGTDASHDPEGLFLAWGPDIGTGAAPADLSVVDVAPTVLHALGRPVPADADGRARTEMFEPDSNAANRRVRTREYAHAASTGEVDDDLEAVETRLKGLGYLE